MELTGNTILITGGASGIGLALAERFLKAGSQVIVCGRRESELAKLQARHPGVRTRACDLSKAEERLALHAWVTKEFPRLNVLVNNAGIQRRLPLVPAASLDAPEPWEQTRQEIAINLEAPIHLCALFAPFLQKQSLPVIINVTSGLAFTPLSFVPVYSATKAALHSYTLSLRHRLSKTQVQVIELAPPAVNTDLGGVGLHNEGVPLAEFADHAVARLAQGELEISYGFSEKASKASREELNQLFKRMNP